MNSTTPQQANYRMAPEESRGTPPKSPCLTKSRRRDVNTKSREDSPSSNTKPTSWKHPKGDSSRRLGRNHRPQKHLKTKARQGDPNRRTETSPPRRTRETQLHSRLHRTSPKCTGSPATGKTSKEQGQGQPNTGPDPLARQGYPRSGNPRAPLLWPRLPNSRQNNAPAQ